MLPRSHRLAFVIAGFLISVLEAGGPLGTVGQPCNPDPDQLSCSVQNSECVEGVCLCKQFHRFHATNGSCIHNEQGSTVGQNCRSGAECRGRGEFCSSFGVCMCLSTHVDSGTQCKPTVYPGQSGCDDSRQCNKGFPGAFCDRAQICQCPNGMISQQQTCLTPNALANMIMADPQPAPSHYPSRMNGRGSQSIGNLQRTPPTYSRRRPFNQETHQNFFKRLQQPASNNRFGVQPDDLCAVDSDCAGYPMSYCDGVCKCINGALNAGSTCVAGAPALSAATCSSGQIYVTEAGSCMTSQNPGEPCQYSQQCSANEPGAFCLKLKCECVYGMQQSGAGCTFVDSQCPQRGFIWISELGACKEVIPPGGKGCSHNLQCQAAYPDATCFLQSCSCPPEFPIAIDGTCGRNCSAGTTFSGITNTCLPTVQPGDQCIYSSQCHAIHPGMICDRNRCNCPNGQVFSGNQCTDSCPQGYRVNSKGVCAQGCAPTQIDFQGECLNQATPGQQCLVNAQCTGGSSCQSGICVCPLATVSSGGVCMPVQSPPLASCANGEQCSGGSFCVSGNCSCPLGQSVLNGQCVTPIAVDIGSACVRVGVTCGGGSICVSGYCVCPLGTLPHHNKCVEKSTAKAGESCAQGEDCTGGSQCNQHSQICECMNPLQIIIGGRCENRLRSHPGYPCSNGEVCVGGSECLGGRCECTDGRVNINKQCVYRPDSKPGMSCGNGERCTGNSECEPTTKKCSCPKGMQSIDDVCTAFSFVGPGESCLALNARCGGQSYCVRGTCQCAENMVALNRKCSRVKQALPGSKCSQTENCVGRSVCKDGSCVCMNPLILNRNRCETARNVHPGETCRPGDHCLANASCKDGLCVCPLGQMMRNGRCEMKRLISPGFLCSRDDVCIGFSTCQNGLCSCPIGQIIVEKRCEEAVNALPGQECGKNIVCTGGSKCLEGMCVCGTDQRIYGNRCQDVVRVAPEASCGNGEVCTGGSTCDRKHRVCRCPQRQFARQGKCVPIVVEINPLRKSTQITTTGTTIDSREIEESTTLKPTTFHRYRCYKSSDCKGGAVCTYGMCVCPQGMVMNKRRKCEPASAVEKPALLLRECSSSSQCSVENSFCDRGQCKCLPGYRIFGSTQCIPRTTTSGTELGTTPIATTTPISFKTIPPRNRGNKEMTTTQIAANLTLQTVPPRALPGWPCNPNTNCLRGSYCVNGFCKCPPGFVELEGMCKHQKLVPPLSSCAHGEICTRGSNCTLGFCFCQQGFMLYKDYCVSFEDVMKLRELEKEKHGSTLVTVTFSPLPPNLLSTTEEPRIFIKETKQRPYGEIDNNLMPKEVESTEEPESQTIASIWTTTTTTTQLPTTNFVEQQVKITYPGKWCDDVRVFCSNGSTCVNSVCQCRHDLILSEDRCISPLEARRCIASNQCPSGAECVRGRCVCPQGMALSRFGFCIPIVYVDPGMSCAEGEQCRYGSKCSDGMCTCQEGLILSQDNKCLPPISDLRLRPPPTKNATELTDCPIDGSCKLPGCFCSKTGTVIPGGLNAKDTPQMIILTFDDPITDRTINIYKSLFDGRIRNPNSCPIKGTFFISHQWNNYDQAQWLYSRGNEIALNSITHETLTTATEQRWRNEMSGLRESLKEFSYVEQESMRGIRAPQLLLGGDNQFAMMQQAGFTYDNSMPLRGGPYWPQTLDHKMAWECEEQNCPTKPFKGLWELPINQLISTTGKYSAMARSAIRPFDSRDAVANMLKRNFLRHYKGNRAPFVITADTDFLTILPDNGAVNALSDFLNDVLNRTDVYVVTATQAIEWMRRPTKVSEIQRFQPWQCQFHLNDHVQPCESPSVCSYSSSSIQGGVPHSFRICGSCPLAYPWIENPLGKRLLTV